MKITWYGTASICIESEGERILFDPYLKYYNKALPRLPLTHFGDLAAIFITHPHLDHFADIPETEKYTRCPIYVNGRGIEIAKQQGFYSERLKPVKPGDSLTFGNISITAYQGSHIKYDLKEAAEVLRRAFKGKFLQALEIGRLNKIYSIDMEKDVLCYLIRAEGKRVFLMGSADLSNAGSYPHNCDGLILPFQGRGDMTAQALKLANALSPKKIIPDHFDDAFPPITQEMDTGEFISKCKIPVILPRENESIEI